MFRHDSTASEAVRCARLAREARRTGDIARAIKLEQRAVELVGYLPGAPSAAWEPSVETSLPVARRAIRAEFNGVLP